MSIPSIPNPFKILADKLDVAIKEKIQAQVTVGVDAALAEIPIAAALLKGEQVTLTMTLQLTKKVSS